MLHLIFDLDGTLFDSAATDALPMYYAVQEVTGKTIPQEEILRHMDGFDHDWYQRDYGITPEQDVEIFQRMHPHFARIRAEHGFPPLFEGALEMMDGLIAAGGCLDVCSARAVANIEESVRSHGIRDRLTHLMGRVDWNHAAKEKAEVLCERIQTLGLNPDKCIMIGDMPGDIRAGKAAGTRTVAVTYGFAPRCDLEPYQPDYFAGSIGELYALLLQLIKDEG